MIVSFRMAIGRVGTPALVAVTDIPAARPYHEQVPVVLGVKPALVVDREWGVGRTDAEKRFWESEAAAQSSEGAFGRGEEI